MGLLTLGYLGLSFTWYNKRNNEEAIFEGIHRTLSNYQRMKLSFRFGSKLDDPLIRPCMYSLNVGYTKWILNMFLLNLKLNCSLIKDFII